MKRSKRKSSSDDDIPLKPRRSEDDLPLSKIVKRFRSKEDREDPNLYANLCRRRDEPCEFCDVVSKSRYSSLIHNAKHIIIPLIKQQTFTCQDCLHCFTSLDDLKNHNLYKHPNFNVTVVLPQLNIKRELGNNCNIIGSKPARLSVFGSPVKEEKVEENTKKCYDKTHIKSPPKPSIKSRLIFEDEDENILNDNLLIDLTTECKVKVELLSPKSCQDEIKPMLPFNEVYKPPWSFSKSVHYEELIKIGMFECSKCYRIFPSRFHAIVHEATHLVLKNTQINLCTTCDQYILGDLAVLAYHHSVYHKESRQSPVKTPAIEYRPTIDNNKTFPPKTISTDNAIERNRCMHPDFDHCHQCREAIIKTSTLMLCDVCFSFCKRRWNVVFEYVGKMSKLGKRFTCDKCTNIFFEVNLVKRICKKYGKQTHHHYKKKKTNTDRLKNISQRLKMLKM